LHLQNDKFMKMEDKILELLAEYLKKTDQTLERMDLAYGILVQHSKELISLRKESETLRKEAIQEARKREIQQEALLKEIFSISKRVGNLEDKNT